MKTQDIGVRVVYRNRDMEPSYTETYTLEEYTAMIRTDLHRLVSDVEELCYAANEGRAKEEWTDETFYGFNKIKHKLLDKAGEVERIPQNLVEITREPLTNFVARIIDEKE